MTLGTDSSKLTRPSGQPATVDSPTGSRRQRSSLTGTPKARSVTSFETGERRRSITSAHSSLRAEGELSRLNIAANLIQHLLNVVSPQMHKVA